MLKKLAPYGVYVMPSIDNIRSKHAMMHNTTLGWNGVIFVRQGYYKNAILRFIISFPEEYPVVAPTVNFTSPVYHPLIHPETGELDLSVLFPYHRVS